MGFRGWGRGLRNGIAKWYLEKDIDKLALQVVKYQGRDGWTHRDVLRKIHVKTNDETLNKIFAWVTHGIGGEVKSKDGTMRKTFPQSIDSMKDIKLIYGFERAKLAENEDEVVKLISEYNLPREAVPTQFMGKKVYGALLPKMPMTALIRNLGNLSKVGILKAGNFDEIKLVVDKITSEENLRKARVHPLQLLMALKIYGAGHGMRGKGEWEVVPQIVDALDEAFYKAFAFVEPTGKRILIALDVSGSMTMNCVAGVEGLTPRAASAVMAMVTMKAEQNWAVVGFTSGRRDSSHNWYMERGAISTLNLSPRMRLDDVERTVDNLPFGGTDCALPAIWAKEQKRDFDAIIILTDNESWAGDIAPTQALKQYENIIGHSVYQVVVAMTATQYSVADPKEATQLDVVGFDSSAPAIISDFISGKL